MEVKKKIKRNSKDRLKNCYRVKEKKTNIGEC